MVIRKSRADDFAEGNVRATMREQALAAQGNTFIPPHYIRIVVLEVINDPSALDKRKLDYYVTKHGVANASFAYNLPRNSIIGRRILGLNSTASEPAMFFMPFLPSHIAVPCKPGEHVWAMFEDPSGTRTDMGWWMWRIVEAHHTDDVNHSHAPRVGDSTFFKGNSTRNMYNGDTEPAYEFRNGPGDETEEGERYTVADKQTIPGDENAYERLLTESDASKQIVYESVPRYKKRPGDQVFEGSNNSLIVMGTDRNGPVVEHVDGGEDSETHGSDPTIPESDIADGNCAMIDIVVGRGQTPKTAGVTVTNTLDREELGKSAGEVVPEEGDPDLINDRTRIRASQRTFVDANLQIEAFNAEFSQGREPQPGIGDSEDGDGATVIKSDKVRIVARSDIELLVTTYERDENGRMIEVGDTSKWAAIVIRNGDIIWRPATQGFVKIGGDDANKAVLCTSTPVATDENGNVTSPPFITTSMGGQVGTGKSSGGADQGQFVPNLLVKAPG